MPASITRDAGLRRARAGSADRAVHRDVPGRRVRARHRVPDRLRHSGVRAVAGRMARLETAAADEASAARDGEDVARDAGVRRAPARRRSCSKRRSRCGWCGCSSSPVEEHPFILASKSAEGRRRRSTFHAAIAVSHAAGARRAGGDDRRGRDADEHGNRDLARPERIRRRSRAARHSAAERRGA